MATSTIEADLVIDGNIVSNNGSVEVKGRVIGDVSSASVVVHVGGSIDGELSTKKLSIEGTYKGSLKCVDLTLASTSEVESSIEAQTLTIENGAKVLGKVEVTGTS